MGKARSITGFGPTVLSLASTGSGDWQKFGPFWGQNISAFAIFGDSATSEACILEGTLTTSSTGAVQTLFTFGDVGAAGQVTGPLTSTQAFNYAFVRLTSTELSTGSTSSTISVFFVANGGGGQ